METLVSSKNGKSSNGKEDVKVTDTKNGAETLKVVTKKPVTVQDRIAQAEKFQVLSEKHRRLQEKDVELEKFVLSNESNKEQITLKNSAGKTVDIQNSGVVAEVVSMLRAKVAAALKQTEEQILTFKI